MKHLALLPKIKEPNIKNESAFRRARSVDTMRSQEELDGIEKQNVKITNYANNNIKKQKQPNGKALPSKTLCICENEEILNLDRKSVV